MPKAPAKGAKKSMKQRAGEPKESAKPPLVRKLLPSQAERLVVAWEELAAGLGELNEIARLAISKQWPDARTPREAIVSRIPTPEEKLKTQTGNTSGPVDEWLSEFDPEEDIGTREREWLEQHGGAGQSKSASSSKASS